MGCDKCFLPLPHCTCGDHVLFRTPHRSSAPERINDMQAEIERMRDEITILRAVACDCVTEISPEGREETRCGSQQMMNALSPQDPMRWPIPCDVRIGSTVIKRGVRFEVLVSKMRYLYRVAERSTGASGGTASGLDERLDQINLWCL